MTPVGTKTVVHVLPFQCEIVGANARGFDRNPTAHTSSADLASRSFTLVTFGDGPGKVVQAPRCSCAIRGKKLASAPAAQTSPFADTRTLLSVPWPRPVATMCHASPFHCSTRISLLPAASFCEPTSQARPSGPAATLVTVAVASPGKLTVRHRRPCQRRSTVPELSVPSAQASDRDLADTAVRLPGAGTPLSATLDQARPFQCRMSGVPFPSPVSASAPTAQAFAGPEAETSSSSAGETTDDGTGTTCHAGGVAAAACRVPALTGEAAAGAAAASNAPAARAGKTPKLDLICPI